MSASEIFLKKKTASKKILYGASYIKWKEQGNEVRSKLSVTRRLFYKRNENVLGIFQMCGDLFSVSLIFSFV